MTDAPTDLQLLRRYAETRAGDAFAELVRRHVDWVYSAARRAVRDPHLAEDVTQAAFILLARKAAKLSADDRAAVAPWLFTATRWTAAAALRSEARRRRREGQAAAEAATRSMTDPNPWPRLEGLLELFVARLRDGDRRAVLLRFYERRSFADVGAALSVSEEAARKRVARAVEKLREMFARRGITSPGTADAAGLSTILAARAVEPAPALVAARAAETALAAHAGGAATAGAGGAAATTHAPLTLANGGLAMMTLSHVKVAALFLGAFAVVAGGGTLLARHRVGGDTVHVHDVFSPAATPAAAPLNKKDDSKKDDGKKDDGKAAKSILDRPIPQVNFDKVALGDAVAFLQDISGATIDWKAIEDAGVPKDSPVTVKLNNATLGKAVRTVFEAAGAEEGPQVTAEGKKIVVKPAEKKTTK